jgi:hypothetical protein
VKLQALLIVEDQVSKGLKSRAEGSTQVGGRCRDGLRFGWGY